VARVHVDSSGNYRFLNDLKYRADASNPVNRMKEL
jgi:hypothetical protein